MDYPKSIPGVGLAGGRFTDGDPANGILPSLDPAAWANAVTDEILNAIRGADLEPSETSVNQLAQVLAMKAPIASPVFTGMPKAPTAAAGTATTQIANTAFVNDALSKAAGLPLLFPLWCPNRAAIPAGYAPADGQALSRSLYPDAWAGIAAGNVPVATDAAWLATPTERGKFTAGDGASTFRLPDYNGKSAGSLGAVFMRGDGVLSAGADGVIQGDAIRNIAGSYCDVVFNRAAAATGALSQGAAVVTGTGASGSGLSGYAMTFDASRVVPTANENRPLNVTGCWVIRLFGAVVNPGAADAAQLATEVSKLWSDKVPFSAFQGGHSANDHLILPGGLILQWGAVPSAPAGGSQLLSYPIAFPGGVLAIVPCAGAGAAGSPGINAQGISNTQVRFWNTSTSTSTQLGSYIAIGF